MLKTAFLLGGKFVIIVCTFRALTALRGKKRKKKQNWKKSSWRLVKAQRMRRAQRLTTSKNELLRVNLDFFFFNVKKMFL